MSAFEPVQMPDHELASPEARKRFDKLCYTNYVALGGTNIPVHLEDDDYNTAFHIAVDTYRSMSTRSVYISYGTLQLEQGKQEYVLDERIDNIVNVWRQSNQIFGDRTGGGQFEPFGAATAHLLLRGSIGQNGYGYDLVSYDLALQYQQTLDRLFARHYHFKYRNDNSTLFLTQTVDSPETVLLEAAFLKSYEELLKDHWAYRWLREYMLAHMRMILGEKYSLFSTMPGAQGGTVMKGDALKQQGAEDKQRLEDDLLLYADSGEIPQPIRG